MTGYSGSLMARPKSSIVGLGDVGLSLYSANKLRKMNSEFDSIRRYQEMGTSMTLSAIGGLADLQMATMHGISELHSQLLELSKISWSIANYFERKETKDDFLGDLKMVLINFEEELDSIDELSENYLEFATLQVESLQSLVAEHDVRIEYFKTLPPNDIKWAKGILDRIEATHALFVKKLSEAGDSDGD
jgi:hypothetical protein